MRTKIRRRPNGRWYLMSVAEDGIERSHGGFKTKREATAAGAALRTDASRGRFVSPDKLTVGGYLEGEWLPSRANADISENSRDVEAIMVRAWIVPHIGGIALQRLSARDLDRLYATLRDRGGRGGRPLRGKSVRNVHVLLSKALGDAVRRGHRVANPVAAVDPPARDDSIERTAWTREEVGRFLEVAGADRLHAIWRLALATGVRRGELLGLRWDEVDLDDGVVHVARQVLLRPDGRELYVRETTKSRRTRRVRFDGSTGAALRRWKAEQAAERLAFGEPWRTDGGHRLATEGAWLVTEANGYIVEPDALLRRWKALVRSAGVTPITLHGARHSYAELALSGGVRLDVLSRSKDTPASRPPETSTPTTRTRRRPRRPRSWAERSKGGGEGDGAVPRLRRRRRGSRRGDAVGTVGDRDGAPRLRRIGQKESGVGRITRRHRADPAPTPGAARGGRGKVMARERCAVCRGKIRRPDSNEATRWLGPAGDNGMALLVVAHEECYAKVTADMHASPRERALLLVNTMGRARAERDGVAMDALQLVAFMMAGDNGEEMFDVLRRTVETEDDDEFRETVERVLEHAGLTVHDRLPDGQTILRREGIDPE